MRKITLQLLILCLALVSASYASAETVITNNVSASSSTGGNTAEGGTVRVGDSSTHVSTETVVNGEVIESFEKTVSAEGGESVTVEREFIYENGEVYKNTVTETTISEGTTTVERETSTSTPEREGSFIAQWFIKLFNYVISLFRS